MNYTAEDIVNLLKARYKTPKGSFEPTVVLEQVPNGTGGFQSRWIDVAVFQMWPSKGLTRSAFEIKISRSDFIHELQQPEKHLWCKECFHEFWFVAPKDVIQIEELPAYAGWMCPQGTRLCIKKHATRNDSPRLDDKLLAAFMRAASKKIDTITKSVEVDALANSAEYKRARECERAVGQFLAESGREAYYSNPQDKEGILKSLREAKLDKGLQQDREHLLLIGHRFQEEIIGLLNLFLVIANKGLLARNDLGEHLVSAFGGITDDNVSSLRKHIHDNQKTLTELLLKLGAP